MFIRQAIKPVLVSVQKIWDSAPHSSMTDLIFYKGEWLCVFRESDSHYKGKHGTIRLIASTDTFSWTTAAIFEERERDLRDPKLCITPDNRLMLLMASCSNDEEHKYLSLESKVTFSVDARTWAPSVQVGPEHEWLWRITWHQEVAYGASYRHYEISEWQSTLWSSTDGINFKLHAEWDIPGKPNECTLRVASSGQMIALVRRDDKLFIDNHAWIGTSMPPYKKWEWNETRYYFGGPNFLIGEEGLCWAVGRLLYPTPYGRIAKTAVCLMTDTDLKPLLYLPSGGDTSYPGLAFHDGHLWISYYSSHEDNTAVYLAKVLIK